MITKEQILTIAEACITDPSIFIVDVKVLKGSVIEVVIDKDTSISIDDCIAMSKAIEGSLDREVQDFELSVYSAGLSEPLLLARQYQKNMGREISVLLKTGIKFNGVIHQINEGLLTLECTKMDKPEGAKRKIKVNYQEVIALTDIKAAKLVIHV